MKAITWFTRALIAALAVAAMFVGASARAQAPDALAGHWEGQASKDGRTFTLALDFDPQVSETVYVDYADLPVYGIQFTRTPCAAGVCIERRPENAPASTLQGAVVGDRYSGVFNGAGARDARFELRRVSRQGRVFREEPVRFRNGDVTLEGLLILPQGDGPFAAAVITHGSNPETRADAGYRSLGVQFARNGVAALIYDKRGVGASTGDYTIASLEDLAKDALAGLNAIRGRPDIRRDAIGVAGHSQGGWISPLAATLSRRVAFVVVSGAPGLNAMEQSIYHNRNEMLRAGFSDAEATQAQDLRRRMYARLRTGVLDDRFLPDLEAASTQPWFAASLLPFPMTPAVAPGVRRFMLFEPAPVWRRVRVPVLAIWGTDDINLPAVRSRDVIAEALREGGNTNATLHVLPDLNHNLFADPAPGAAWDFPRGSTAYPRIMSEWIAANGLASVRMAAQAR